MAGPPNISQKYLNLRGPKEFYDIVDFVNASPTTTERVLSITMMGS
jgi:hypothetical protein